MNKYAINIHWSQEDQGYIATCPEFPGLSAFGETQAEALSEAEIALRLMIKTYEEDSIPLPEPQFVQDYSGQLRLRLSKSQHRLAAQMAERDGISLNGWLVNAVEEKLGIRKGVDSALQELRQHLANLTPKNVFAITSYGWPVQSVEKIEKKVTTTEASLTTYTGKPKESERGN